MLIKSAIFFIGIYFLHSIACKQIILYDPSKDDIELLDVSTYEKVVFNSPKATIIEFFAHWCGTCQRFAPHWKELAKDTKPWHEKVVRVAALDCALTINDPVCLANRVEFYPTFKFFPPMSDNRTGLMREDEHTTNEKFMDDIIDFLEGLAVKPAHYPDLSSFTSDKLETLFEKNPTHKYALLIFEPDSSFVGRKIILDFSVYVDKLVIRHVTPGKNKALFEQLKVPLDTKPVVYIVSNVQNVAKYETLDAFLESSKNDVQHNLIHFEESHEVNGDRHPTDHKDDLRYIHAKSIRKFIKYHELLSDQQLDKLADDIEAGQLRNFEPKKVIKQYLNQTNYRVHMIDLESGLSYMLRHELTRDNVIKGDDLKVLKNWINVLAKYYPGRKPVHNFLMMVSSRLSSYETEIKIEDWEKIVEFESPQVFLPQTLEFRHCKGSTETYRGYPCSLWTLFHVLTVSHVQMEKQKDKAFENFDPTEVILAVRGYITHFFGCRECGQNFEKETVNATLLVKKPFDEVTYLWQVHNRVNKRLSGDQTEDPEHPKIQFPRNDKCPRCYKDAAEFDPKESMYYLLSFYSIHAIEGEEELDKASAAYFEKKKKTDEKKVDQPIEAPPTEKKATEEVKKQLDDRDRAQNVIDIPKDAKPQDEGGKKENTENRWGNPLETKQQKDEQKNDKNRVDYESVRGDTDMFDSKNHTIDLLLSITVYTLVLITFFCLYFYFKMLRRRSRLKKRGLVNTEQD